MTDFYLSRKAAKKKRQTLITEHYQSGVCTLFKVKMESQKKHHHHRCILSSRGAQSFYQKHKHPYDAASIRKGYFFCASRNFSEYAVYTTKDQFVFKDSQKKFISTGTCIATAIIDDDSALEHINVETAFQHQGIGRRLIQFITKHAPQFYVFTGVEHNSRYRLTEEGAALIKSCQRKKILQHDQVIETTVPQSPSSHSRSSC